MAHLCHAEHAIEIVYAQFIVCGFVILVLQVIHCFVLVGKQRVL